MFCQLCTCSSVQISNQCVSWMSTVMMSHWWPLWMWKMRFFVLLRNDRWEFSLAASPTWFTEICQDSAWQPVSGMSIWGSSWRRKWRLNSAQNNLAWHAMTNAACWFMWMTFYMLDPRNSGRKRLFQNSNRRSWWVLQSWMDLEVRFHF